MGATEGDLPLQQRRVVGLLHLRRGRQVVEVHQMFVEPRAVGTLGGDLLLDLGVVDDPALLGIHEKHAAGLEAALEEHVLGRYVEHAGLGGHDDETILGDIITRGAETVAVKHGADLPAVGERDGGRAIPRLQQTGMILVKGPTVVVHALVVGPRLRDHHHHRMRQRTAGEDEQLKGVIEHRRVAAVGIDDREHFLHVLAERLRHEKRLPGVHPVDVAPERVDLAVVRQVTVGMGAGPTRKGVGAES